MLWVPIKEFDRYSVSETGLVRHEEHNRVLTRFKNNGGSVYVCLHRGPEQFKRGLAKLVADHFLEPDHRPAFDTPINLDGDRYNNEYWNLTWRPRWFAIQYHKQFEEEVSCNKAFIEVNTGAYFPDVWSAATCYGLLARKVFFNTLNGESVWPTMNKFRFVD